MTERMRRLSRRNFLFTVGAGSAATAATIVAKKSASEAQPATGPGKRATRGYKVSEHINNYYRTTKV